MCLVAVPFGLFDDSFHHKKHAKENEPNWNGFGSERWKRAPTGGEFSFFAKVDQTKALAEKGPHGTSFEKQAAKFHISFMIGDSQPEYQSADRIRTASQSCGYRFCVTEFKTNNAQSRVSIRNQGIAPIYRISIRRKGHRVPMSNRNRFQVAIACEGNRGHKCRCCYGRVLLR